MSLGSEMITPALESRQIELRTRPIRVAYFLPKSVTLEECDRLLAKVCAFWGGHRSLFVPLTQTEIHPTFEQLLRLYDPDVTVLYDTPGTPLAQVDVGFPGECLLENRAGLSFSFVMREVPRRHQTSIGTILRQHTDSQPLCVWNGEGPTWFRLLAHQRFGHLTVEQIEQLTNPPASNHPELQAQAVQVEYLPESEASVWFRGTYFDGDDRYGPRRACMSGIGGILRNADLHPSEDALLRDDRWLVIGDSLADFCLYHDLSILTDRASWVPFQEAQTWESLQVDPQPHEWRLYRLLQDLVHEAQRSGTTMQLCSTSVEKHALDECKTVAEAWCADTFAADDGKVAEFAVHDRHTRLGIPYYYEWVDANAFSLTTGLFRDSIGAQCPLPRTPSFWQGIDTMGQVGWMCEVRIESQHLPQVAGLVPKAIDTHIPGYARLSRHGVAFGAVSPLRLSHLNLESQLFRPYIRIVNQEDALDTALRQLGRFGQASDKGRYTELAVQLAGGLQSLCDLVMDPVAQHMLALYTHNTKKSSPQRGDCEHGVILDKKRYLDINALLNCVSHALQLGESDQMWQKTEEFLSRWLNLGLLDLGFWLHCKYCSHSDWYSLGQVDDGFVCNRCRLAQKLTLQSRHRVAGHPPRLDCHLALNELFYQFVRHNSWLTAIGLSSLQKASTSFMYWPEVGIWPNEERAGHPEMEADFLACCDGRLVVGECKSGSSLSKDDKHQLRTLYQLANELKAEQFVFVTSASSDGCLSDKLCRILGSPSRLIPEIRVLTCADCSILGSTWWQEPAEKPASHK